MQTSVVAHCLKRLGDGDFVLWQAAGLSRGDQDTEGQRVARHPKAAREATRLECSARRSADRVRAQPLRELDSLLQIESAVLVRIQTQQQ